MKLLVPAAGEWEASFWSILFQLGSGVDKLLDNKRQSSDLKIKLLQSELDKYQTQECAESGLNKSLAFSSQIISSQFAIWSKYYQSMTILIFYELNNCTEEALLYMV